MREKYQEGSDKPLHELPPNVDMTIGPGRDSDNRQFGAFLTRLRAEAGLSRADASAALGVSSEYLRLIEAGKRTPALGQMRGLLAAYRAEGEVERLQPGGDRPDLIVRDPHDGEPVIVEFASRIREARRRGGRYSPARLDRHDGSDDSSAKTGVTREERAADLGLVVSLLVEADESTLLEVRQLLEARIGM